MILRHRKILIWSIVSCSLIVLTSGRASSATAQSRHGDPYKLDLGKTVDRFEVDNMAIGIVIQQLAYRGISIGAEIPDYRNVKVSLSLHNASFKEILDELLAKLPGYDQKVVDGMVYIYSRRAPLRLLDEKIPSFACNGLGITGTIVYLGQEARKAGLSVATGVDHSTASWADEADLTPIDEKLDIIIGQRTSLRVILNRIIAADPPAFWVAYPMPDGRLAVIGGSVHSHKEESPINKKLRESRKHDKPAIPGL